MSRTYFQYPETTAVIFNDDPPMNNNILEDFDRLIVLCMELLVKFQRKEQLPRKFVVQDWDELKAFEGYLNSFMNSIGECGADFLRERLASPFVISSDAPIINTRELKRCLKLLVKVRDEWVGSQHQPQG